ncbi:cysteine hydrolase family protein [Aestuariimicrobium soli]|uniref:cysteine hydrolase family protein n=1 Tax=Aestuariimicrobium soli TaxID=2035834 RepID=UPI003EBB362E
MSGAGSQEAWLLVIDPQRIFADPASEWCAPEFERVVEPIDRLVAQYGERTIVTRWLPGTNRRGSWAAYFERWTFADRPDGDPMFELVEAAVPWAARRGGETLDVSTFGKFGDDLLAITGPEPSLVLTGVATDCCVISTALAAADAGATVEVVGAGCAGSSAENHAAALQVMGLYAPQITVR